MVNMRKQRNQKQDFIKFFLKFEQNLEPRESPALHMGLLLSREHKHVA